MFYVQCTYYFWDGQNTENRVERVERVERGRGWRGGEGGEAVKGIACGVFVGKLEWHKPAGKLMCR